MNRVERVAAWLFAAGAAAFGLAVPLGVDLTATWWRFVIGAGGIFACFVGVRRGRLPVVFVLVNVLAGLFVVAAPTNGTMTPVDRLGLTGGSAHTVIGLGLICLLVLALRSRRGRFDHRDTIDVLIVAIGASIGAWILLASRLIERGEPAHVSIVNTAPLVVATLIVTFVIDLLFTNLLDNVAMRFVAVAGLANLLASIVTTMSLTTDADPTSEIATSVYAAAYMLMCGAFSMSDVSEILTPEASSDDPTAYTPLRMALTATCLMTSGVLVASLAPLDGTDVAVRITALIALVSLVVARLVVAVRSHEVAQAALIARLHRDDLTNLPNRLRLVRTLDDVLERAWRSEFRPMVIQINLDRFKNINDNLGHYQANRVLIAVGERLVQAAEQFDGFVARSGGDGFAVLDSATRSTTDAMERVETIRRALAEPITFGETSVFITASCGVTIAPRARTVTAEELMRQADIASHQAKVNGRNGAALFDDSMQAHLARRMDVEHALHGAIGRDEMRLYYQPIVDVATGVVTGFEALIRWLRNDTVVSPADFIPIAEETGIICELGAWAVREAMDELRGWIEDGIVDAGCTMSVNVSPRQILDHNFPAIVQEALVASNMPAELLWLEMTESMMLEEPEIAKTTLCEIRSTGVRLALDDFGTGFSSLSLLQQFPIQRLKIDRAFVQGIADEGHDRSLVLTIVALAKSMGLDLVAEGVETVHQLEALGDLACDKAQGYLISRPVPAEAMRSTMVALEELTSLSLFRVRPDAEPEEVVEEPIPVTASPVTTSPAMQLSRALSMTGSRPLGQPVL